MMDVQDRKAIIENRSKLCRVMDPDDLLPVLLHKEVFSKAMVERIEGDRSENTDPHVVNARIIADIVRRGPRAFAKFLDALIETGHEDAARLLKPDLEIPDTQSMSSSQRARGLRVQKSFKKVKWDQQSCYRMKSSPLGFCVIINNVEFEYNILRPRLGSDADATRLSDVFSDLDYKVMIKRNLTSVEIRKLFQQISTSPDLEHHDSLVVIVLSHGETEEFYGTDNQLVNIRVMLSYFNNRECPALKGKPKMFFIQACRGRDMDYGCIPEQQLDAASFEEAILAKGPQTACIEPMAAVIHLESLQVDVSYSDMIVSYSTVHGFVSLRHPMNGSWYCTALALQLTERAKDHELVDILRKVDVEVQKRTTEDGWKQTTATELIGFNKQLWFNC